MAVTSWHTRLQRKIERATAWGDLPPLDDVRLYLFGSAMRRPNPMDLDLLLVYDESRIRPRAAICLRDELVRFVEEEFRLPVDVVVLSGWESLQTRFIEAEGAIPIWDLHVRD
jgi:hypothetical protein